MAEIMAYGASVGSEKAKKKVGATGFIGNATDATAGYFGQPRGYGTMPHSLIGYAGSTVRAAEMFHETHPTERSEEHTSELQSLMRISYAVFCLKKKKKTKHRQHSN